MESLFERDDDPEQDASPPCLLITRVATICLLLIPRATSVAISRSC
jgi:hypothetical protein